MAAATLISVEEYLNTSYHPDRDYVDGELLERNVGELYHSETMSNTLYYLRDTYPQLRRRVLLSLRVQVNASRVRVPDVCVLAENAPDEQVPRIPPALCVEILAQGDRFAAFMERLDDYFRMGVPVCWVIDPLAPRAWIATHGQLVEPSDGILRAGEIEMPLRDILKLVPSE